LRYAYRNLINVDAAKSTLLSRGTHDVATSSNDVASHRVVRHGWASAIAESLQSITLHYRESANTMNKLILVINFVCRRRQRIPIGDVDINVCSEKATTFELALCGIECARSTNGR
jgi:hypothetical protein